MSEIDGLYRRFARTGDRGALADLYEIVAPDLLLVATHHLGDANTAEDAVQAAFLAVMERRGRHDAKRAVRPWLMGAVLNQARLQRRSAGRRVDPCRTEPTECADPGQVAEAQELVRAVRDSVALLPETYRTVLDLRLRRGLAPHEIATRLDRPAGTVRSQLARGLAEVRRALPPGFAATVTVLAASEVSAAAGRVAAISAVGTTGAGGVTMVGAPIKLGAICFTVGLAVALPLAILAGTVPVIDSDPFDGIEPVTLEAAASPQPDIAPASPPPPTETTAAAAVAAPAATIDPPLGQNPAGSKPPAWVLTGQVNRWVADLDKLHPPIPGCRVEIHLHFPSYSDGPRNQPFADLVTDKAGRFQVDLNALRKLHPQDLDGLEVVVFAHTEGLVGEDSVNDLPEDPGRSYRGKVELSLEPGAVLRGRVVDPEGRPVRLGYVGFPDGEDTDTFEESELVDGRYRIVVYEPGPRRVRAVVPGRGVTQDLEVQVRALETLELPDLVLGEGSVIDGRAVYPDGSPARDLILEYSREIQNLDSRWAERGKLVTDGRGRFRITDLERTAYLFEPDLDFTDKTEVRLEPGQPDATVTVCTPVIVVKTRDAAGRPRSKVPLRILGWCDAHADRAQAIWSAGGNLGALRREARHYQCWNVRRRSGIFSFAVPAGSFWVIRAELPGHRSVERAVRVTPDRFEHQIDLTIEPLKEPGLLRIAVRDPDGRPVKRFFVTLAPARTGIPLPRMQSRLSGSKAEFPGLTPGRYRLAVTPRQEALRTEQDRIERVTLLPMTRVIEVRPGANRVVLDAQLGSRLAVRFRLSGPIESSKIPCCNLEIGGAVRAQHVRGQRFFELAENGVLIHRERFLESRALITSHRFRPGTRRVCFRFEGYEPAEVVIPFEAGRLHETDLHLRPAPVRPDRAPCAPHR